MNEKECVICTGPINYAHLGVNCCRACAVFYKRAAASTNHLKCKGAARNCIELNPRTSCRLCRFTKIEEVLKKASGCQASIEPIPEEDGSNQSEPYTSKFINHESYFDDEPSTSQTPQLDRLRKGYSLMCLIRHSGEMGTRTKCEEELEIPVGSLVLVPATYNTYPQHRKICNEAIKASAAHAFTDYRDLDSASKEFISRTALGMINSLDSSYRTMHLFPDDDEIRTPGYTTYIRPNELETFFANNPDSIDSEKIAGEVRKTLDISVNVARRFFKQVKPTDYEFLAVLGLAVWNDEIATLSEKVQKIAMRNREVIMRELHAYYSRQGTVNYAGRIGQLFCIIMNFQNNVARLHQDFEFYRLKNLFQEYIENDASVS